MSKMTDFYSKVMSDESLSRELSEILGGRDIASATDEQLERIGVIAEKTGFDITVEEAKAFLDPEEAPLDDDDLDAVAGGKGETYVSYNVTCTAGGGYVNPGGLPTPDSVTCTGSGGNVTQG